MSFKETANVKHQTRRLVFSNVEWLDLGTFKERLRQNGMDSVHPFVNTIDGRVYIGKGVLRIGDANDLHEYIGVVSKLSDGTWNLDYIKRNGGLEELLTVQNDFLVMSIPDLNSYAWIRAQMNMVPKYALRETNSPTGDFVYVAKTISGKNVDDNADEVVMPNIGTVDSSEWLLSVFDKSYNQQVFKHEDFSMLCLKPSPASLKELSRLAIRASFSYDNRSILKLNKIIPDTLTAYLEYPRHLYAGDVLLPGDKLISKCGEYELYLIDYSDFTFDKSTSALIFRRIDNDSELDFEVNDVESLVLKNNKIIFCFTNDRSAHCFYQLLSTDRKYRMNLCVSSTCDTPFAIIETLQDNGMFEPVCIQDYDGIKKYRGTGFRERIYDDLYSDRSDENDDEEFNSMPSDDYEYYDYDEDGFEYEFS
jgi:hypothetical protein